MSRDASSGGRPMRLMLSPGEGRKQIREKDREQAQRKSVVRVAKRSQRTRTTFDRSKMMESYNKWPMRKASSTLWQAGSRICLTYVAIAPVAPQRSLSAVKSCDQVTAPQISDAVPVPP